MILCLPSLLQKVKCLKQEISSNSYSILRHTFIEPILCADLDWAPGMQWRPTQTQCPALPCRSIKFITKHAVSERPPRPVWSQNITLHAEVPVPQSQLPVHRVSPLTCRACPPHGALACFPRIHRTRPVALDAPLPPCWAPIPSVTSWGWRVPESPSCLWSEPSPASSVPVAL